MSDESAPDDEDQGALERTLDLLVFAPLGLALTAVEDLPALVARGRQEVSNARTIGKFVVEKGQQEVTRRLSGLLGGGDPASEEAAAPDAAGDADPTALPAPTDQTPPAPPPTPRPVPDPADTTLVEGALAGYDTLSASQVVRRLESLGPDELRAVYRHEASHRNRRTILNRTNQLLDEGSAGTAPTPASAAE